VTVGSNGTQTITLQTREVRRRQSARLSISGTGFTMSGLTLPMSLRRSKQQFHRAICTDCGGNCFRRSNGDEQHAEFAHDCGIEWSGSGGGFAFGFVDMECEHVVGG